MGEKLNCVINTIMLECNMNKGEAADTMLHLFDAYVKGEDLSGQIDKLRNKYKH